MRVVVSPYHLTTREPPAMVALLLARRAYTLMPVPAGGEERERVERLAALVPTYSELMRAWSWSAPLWESGLIRSLEDGEDPARDVRSVVERIFGDRSLRDLGGFIDASVYADERTYLAAVSSDLLRGGPDPGVCVPVACGLDRFAHRHGMIVARAEPTSLAQRAEASLAQRVATVVLPVFLQIDAESLRQARVMLEPELESIRGNLEALAEVGASGSEASALLRGCVARYTEAFEEVSAELARERSSELVRLVTGMASVALVRLPPDAALLACVRAAETARSKARHAPGELAGRARERWCGAPGERALASIIVKSLGRGGPAVEGAGERAPEGVRRGGRAG